MNITRSFVILFVAAIGLCAQASNVTTTVATNPIPAEKFSNFNHFEMAKIVLVAPYAGQAANEKALLKIQENVSLKANPMLKKWNETGAAITPIRTLIITPQITEIKFISGGARFFVGGMAGNSGVIMNVKFTDKETGKEVAMPLFFAQASGRAGGWTMGATDNLMLTRVATRFTDYLEANYRDAVGGPTGVDNVK